MTDSRPEITVRADGAFVVLHIGGRVMGPITTAEASYLWRRIKEVSDNIMWGLHYKDVIHQPSDWVGKVFEENCAKFNGADLDEPVKEDQPKKETWRDRERLL